MVNLGGYDNNSFHDSNGVAFLTLFLQKNHNIKAMFENDDTIPNLDGTLQLLEPTYDKKRVPKQIFHVQIKTLNHDYNNLNTKGEISQYKYSVDTKVFNVVKSNITFDPILLFLVDALNKKIFYLYISMGYVINLNIEEEEKKTIYFNDSNLIDSLETFHQKLVKIHEAKVLLNSNGYENIITTNHAENSKMFLLIQKEWEYLDDMLTNQFKLATDFMYPNTWKFGIAYEEGIEYITIGIYHIKRGLNDLFIKDFSSNKEDCFMVSYYKKDRINIREVINGQLYSLLKKYYEIAWIPANCLSKVVLEEIAFYFLDLLAEACDEFEDSRFICTYYKEQEKVSELRKYWNALVSYELKAKKNIIEKYKKEKNVEAEFNPLGSLLSMIVPIANESKEKFFEELRNSNDTIHELPYPLIYSSNYSYQLFDEVINELEKREIEMVNRLCEPKKYNQMFKQYKELKLSGINRNETGYLIEDIYSNIEKILNELSEAYKFSADKSWKKYFPDRTIKKEYSIIFDNTDYSSVYYRITRESYKFNVIVNDYLIEELKKLKLNEESLSLYNAKSFSSGILYGCCKLKIPIYNHIWYLLNLEMWNKSDIKKPVQGLEYLIN